MTALGNVLKYAQRYGKKDGANRKDLMKILHYSLIALHQHDLDDAEQWPEEGRIECDFSNNYVYKGPEVCYNISTNYENKETK